MTESALPNTPDDDPLVDLARKLRADASHLALATRAAGQRWRRLHYWLGGPAAVTAAVAGISAIQSNTTIAAVFAIASAVFGALTTWLNPGSTAGSFVQTSRQYASVATRIEALLRLELEGGSGDLARGAAKTKLMELQQELSRIRDGSPEVPDWALNATASPNLEVMVVAAPPPILARLPWR